MKLYFDDPTFDVQVQRTVAKAPYGCCDLGEVFAIAARITPGDYDSWYREWFAAGESNQEVAEEEAKRGRRESARQAYLRAGECYRSAYFFCRRDIDGKPLQDAWSRNREMFRAALPLLKYPTERVQIPFEGIHVEGYVMKPASGDVGPTVLIPSGYDGPVEESFSLGACEAVARGFGVVMFSGPGQAEMLYERKIPFRPDFETVVGPVIDFVESRDDLDAKRIAIVGRSFGGYLAPRAAANETRITALTADPAQTDMGAAFRALMPPAMTELFDKNDPAFNDEIWKAYPGVAGQEYWLSRAHAHGLSTPLEYAHEMTKYVVDVDAIACPTFVSYGEGDFAQSTTKVFYDRLKVENKRFIMYRDADGGGGHCEGMGPSRYYTDVFGWLQDLSS
jgi:pimeloyl-ACP methyl ester carboxylesterase